MNNPILKFSSLDAALLKSESFPGCILFAGNIFGVEYYSLGMQQSDAAKSVAMLRADGRFSVGVYMEEAK